MLFVNPPPLNPTDPADHAGWMQLPAPHPAVRGMLRAAQSLAALTAATARHAARRHPGTTSPPTAWGTDLQRVLSQIARAPVPQRDPVGTPADAGARGAELPWEPGYGAWFQRVRATEWFAPDAQRLWQSVTRLTLLAARWEAHLQASEQDGRAATPAVLPNLDGDAWLRILDAARDTLPELPAHTTDAASDGTNADAVLWHAGRGDPRGFVAWRWDAAGHPLWWRAADGTPARFARIDQAVRTLAQHGARVVIPEDGRVAALPAAVRRAWETQASAEAPVVATTPLPHPATSSATPAAPPPAPRWPSSAVSARDAVAHRVPDPATPEPLFSNEAPDRVASRVFPLRNAAALVDAMPSAAEDRAPRSPAHPPEIASDPELAAVKAADDSGDRAPATSDGAPPAPWRLQKLASQHWVCYRWNAQGRPEWWHDAAHPAPETPTLWDARRMQQWLADPAHAEDVVVDDDPQHLSVALAAGLRAGAPDSRNAAPAPVAAIAHS